MKIEEKFDSFLNREDLDGDYNELLYVYEAGYREKEVEIQELKRKLEKSKGEDLDIVRYNPFDIAIKTLKQLL